MKLLTQREIPHEILAEVEETGNKLPCWTLIFGGLKMIYGHQVRELVNFRGWGVFFFPLHRIFQENSTDMPDFTPPPHLLKSQQYY